MATTANIVDVIASEAGIPASVVAMKARYLTHASVLPKGGRGTGAPQLTSRDAAQLILALAHDGPAVETAEAVRALGAYPVMQSTKIWSHGGRHSQYEVDITSNGGTLLDALAGMIDAARVEDGASADFAHAMMMLGTFSITQSGGVTWAQIEPSMFVEEKYNINLEHSPVVSSNEPVFLFSKNDEKFAAIVKTPRTLRRRTSVSFSMFFVVADALGKTNTLPAWPAFRRLTPSTEESQ